LYLTSGHLPILYKDAMFPPMRMDEHREERERIKKRIDEIEKLLAS
jgi:hypothetical protein